MSYQLQTDETLGDGVRRICLEQIEEAIEASGAKRNGKSSPVHQTRKHLKKTSAALTLLASAVGRDEVKQENHRLREVRHLISDIRDAEVRLQTVRDLRNISKPEKAHNFAETEELLTFELENFLAAFADWQAEAKTKLSRTRGRIAEWPVNDLSCEQICRSVQRSYKKARSGLATAIKKPTAENFHEFRKSGKKLWYQLRILRPVHPAIVEELADELKTICQHLGHSHDLAFLAERLELTGRGRKRWRAIRRLIDAQEKELQRTSARLGEHFFAQRPKKFARRLAEYFSEWEIAWQRTSPSVIAFRAA